MKVVGGFDDFFGGDDDDDFDLMDGGAKNKFIDFDNKPKEF